MDEEFELGYGGMNSELYRSVDIDWNEVVVLIVVSMEVYCVVAIAGAPMSYFVLVVDEVAVAGSAEHGAVVAEAPVAVMVAEGLCCAAK